MITKINEVAKIVDVVLSEKLIEWNEDNNALRVRLIVSYSSESLNEDKEEGVLSLADFEKEGARVGKTYTCLINFDSLLTDKHDERAQKKALEIITSKFKDKKARFSTFDITITELSDGKGTVINNGTIAYSGLSNTYLGKVDDLEGETRKLKARLKDMLDDDFEFGELED